MKRKGTLIIFLIASSIQLSANVYGQGITLSVRNESLQNIFREIQKQTEYNFIFSDNDLAIAEKVTMSVKNASLADVLQRCFNRQPLTYVITDKMVIIKRKRSPERDKPGNGEGRKPIDVKGQVTNEKGEPLAGATISVKGTTKATSSNADGTFILTGVTEGATLVISSVGYEIKTVRLTDERPITIHLKVSATVMKTVTISTGYQQIPKERATGSFEFINKEELSRRAGVDILSRLEGVTTSILFDRRNLPVGQNTITASNIIIRGISTITESIKAPLIVLNNFPYEGNINNINPNDVESITILKDAAAASIWGARAGNGVIVITTKQGQFNQPARLSINSSINIIEKPGLFHYPRMLPTEFIDVESFLFDKGFYDGDISSTTTRPALTPVVEILAQQRAGTITAGEATAQIDALRKLDVRNDFSKHIYRTSVNQQYALNLSGGSEKIKYSLSGGFDKNPAALVGDQLQRVTLRSDNTFAPVKNLELTIGIGYTHTTAENNSIGNIDAWNYVSNPASRRLYPYAQLTDAAGNPVTLPHDYRTGYIDTAGAGKLLDWKYRPLDELNLADNTVKQQDIMLNAGIQYTFTKWLRAQANYQYEHQNGELNRYYNKQTYYARNLINLFTQINGNSIKYIVPNEGILFEETGELTSHAGRMQLTINNTWNDKHQVSGIAGTEIREGTRNTSSRIIYGFNKETRSASNVDFTTFFPLYGRLGGGSSRIPGGLAFNKKLDRFVSLYANAAYTYDNRYTISGSVRRDAANLFGVDINKKWKPLWSAGLSWNISNESFYNLDAVRYLRLRLTYGYQGNVNNSISPYTILQRFPASGSIINQPSANIMQPADPSLSWETIRQLNAGLDFRILDDRISGSIEYYQKRSTNLIFNATIDPTTGVSAVHRNSANMQGRGIDLSLTTLNLKGKLKWQTDLLLSYVSTKVTQYLRDDSQTFASGIVEAGGLTLSPVKGYAPYGLYSYRFAGLDPVSGSPQGYINKQVSTDYAAIQQQLLANNPELVYHGPGIPPYFGNLNNMLSYKNIALLVNIAYRFGYYFRKSTISYYSLYNQGITHPDFGKRWQKPGDEQSTTVPSMVYPLPDTYRDMFYAGSSVNVLKGDHIRLQSIKLSYTIDKTTWRLLPMQNLEFYLIATNLGILWRANKEGLDPDYDSGNAAFPPLKMVALGLKVIF